MYIFSTSKKHELGKFESHTLYNFQWFFIRDLPCSYLYPTFDFCDNQAQIRPPLKFSSSSKIQVTMLRVTYSLVSWKYVIKNFLSHYLIYSWILYLIFFSLTKQVQVFIFTEVEKILNIKGKKISKMSCSYFFLHLAIKKLNRKNIYT